jgi:protein-S-isoprenylcysteine O-methyltransferase Ste14
MMLRRILASRFFTLGIHLTPILVLLLAGWGWDDWRGFFENPARTGLMVIILLSAGLVLLFRLDLHPLRRGLLPGGNQTLVLLALALASLFLIWFLPFADRRHIFGLTRNPSTRYFGLGLCCGGIAVRLLALSKLGRHFSAYVTLQDGHQLVRSGIYGTIRHPLYLSLLLAAPGFALIFASALVWPILLVTLIFVTTRIREEDNLLESRFGAEFQEYRQHTGALFPRIVRFALTAGAKAKMHT